jgi:hypothetical protein
VIHRLEDDKQAVHISSKVQLDAITIATKGDCIIVRIHQKNRIAVTFAIFLQIGDKKNDTLATKKC